MRDYRGQFEVHLTARADGPAAVERFAGWCRDRGFKCVRIVLSRGDCVEQPMATWRLAGTALPVVLAEAERYAADAAACGFTVTRVKIEAGPHNGEVPATDADAADHPPGCYFESHVKLRLPAAAPLDALLAVCGRHAAHLSRNAFRDGGEWQERFVTQRAYQSGWQMAEGRLEHLLADLEDHLGETVVDRESEFCVYDSNLSLDAGWLPGSGKGIAVNDTPPAEVLTEFLRGLREYVADAEAEEQALIPVLRGSLLLRHWFKKKARPAADIDLECFVTERQEGNNFYPQVGPDGDFWSRVDFGKAMCRYAANSTDYRPPPGDVGIRFQAADAPADGASLWVYGTPGERYYAGWEWPGRRRGAKSGQLQIDLAEPGPYTPADLGVAPLTLTAPGGTTFAIPAYSPEAMLAAKVSWLVRSLRPPGDGFGVIWSGEPKDLFDAHLLATAGKLRADVFRRAMLAVGDADGLNWNDFDHLFAHRRAEVPDNRFANWPAFAERHPGLAPAGPATLLAELADRLEPLLGDLYPAAHLPLLAAIAALPDKELPYLVYADWLDDRGDDRAAVVREVARFLFRAGDAAAARAAVEGASPGWLRQLFGTTARLREFHRRIGIGGQS
jgi:uncharacterized protein (TIGR02996 family)